MLALWFVKTSSILFKNERLRGQIKQSRIVELWTFGAIKSWGILKGAETYEEAPHHYRGYYPIKTKIEKTQVKHTDDAAV